MQVNFLKMFREVVSCMNVNVWIIKSETEEIPDFDFGIRTTLLDQTEKDFFVSRIYETSEPGVLRFIRDFFETEYCIIPVPKEEKEYGDFIVLGPYRDALMGELELHQLIESKAIPRVYLSELKEYYNGIPIIVQMNQWHDLCINMTKILYGDSLLVRSEYQTWEKGSAKYQEEKTSDVLAFRMIEERYRAEGEILKNVSRGNIDEALKALKQMGQYRIEQRLKDPVRDSRNGLIIFNSLLRKATEAGFVHPAHIDALSSEIAKKIETINSHEESLRYMPEMIRKYCILVKNYSLKGCSPVIQKVVNHINLNLTTDLSLKKMALDYSVNASYLSAQFKKEMGMTITDYTNRQRIRRAITLLNATDMQIQDIASESGIYDVNYFRKLFKKITGMTPSEYSRQVRSHSPNHS